MEKVKKKYRLKLTVDLCKGCRLCVDFCPNNMLELTEDQINKKGFPFARVLHGDDCIGCLSCTAVCPDGVIEIYEVEQE